MRKLITILALFGSLASMAQDPTNYTKVQSRYNWLAGYFRALNIPADSAVGLKTGQWPGDGAIMADTLGGDAGIYYYLDSAWVRIADTTDLGPDISNLGSSYRLWDPVTPGIKTLAAGTGISIDSSTANTITITAASSTTSAFADLTTSIVDEDGFYNGFPWPVQKGDTTIVFVKHSTTHANAGTLRYYKSWNGGRSWTTGANVSVDGTEITATNFQTGVFDDRITLLYADDNDTAKYAYSDNGGVSFTSAGYVLMAYEYNSWAGAPSIQSMFKIASDTLYSAIYATNADSSLATLNYSADNGVSWQFFSNVLLQPGGSAPNGQTTEWSCVITELGDYDRTTKMAALFRNEDYGYYTHVSTDDGFATSTEDVTNLMYEFGNQVDRAPVTLYNLDGTIYVICGNRRLSTAYGLEYVTISASSFYANTQADYSTVKRLYASSATQKAAAIDWGYAMPYTYNGKPYVTVYDVSPAHHTLAEGSDDDVRSINFPLQDRGYSEAFNDANQSITDSTSTLVTFPDLLLDCMGSYKFDGNAGTIDTVWTAIEDGWYSVNAIATFEASSSGSYRQMWVVVADPAVNTTTTNQLISKKTIAGHSSNEDFNRVECNGMAYIKSGEQVKVYVEHDAPSALNLLNTSRESRATIKITLVR